MSQQWSSEYFAQRSSNQSSNFSHLSYDESVPEFSGLNNEVFQWKPLPSTDQYKTFEKGQAKCPRTENAVEPNIMVASGVSKVSLSVVKVGECARKSAEAAIGSPYRRHTADLIRRIDILLSRRSSKSNINSSNSSARARKPRSGGGQRPRARNVVLRELVELLRKAKRDDEVNIKFLV